MSTNTGQRWTRNKPTKAGWYWWRAPESEGPSIVWVSVINDKLRAMFIDCSSHLVTDWYGEWLGPIAPDDRAEGRVEGLREIGDYAATECVVQCSDGDRWQCGHNAAGKWIASVCEKKIREAGL